MTSHPRSAGVVAGLALVFGSMQFVLAEPAETAVENTSPARPNALWITAEVDNQWVRPFTSLLRVARAAMIDPDPPLDGPLPAKGPMKARRLRMGH